MKSTSSISYLNSAAVMRAWALFDTANSAHALVIAAAIFPAYYLNITDEEIFFLGQKWKDSTLYALGYFIFLSGRCSDFPIIIRNS
jgi:MFS-type transporter involved in bile tolerance (Atg22 family)